MTVLDDFINKFNDSLKQPALIFGGREYSYDWLFKQVELYESIFRKKGYENQVIQLIADYSPEAIAMMLALFKITAIVSLVTNVPNTVADEYAHACFASHRIQVNNKQQVSYEVLCQEKHDNACIETLIHRKQPGIIIMSSGSTGKSKAILHDASILIARQLRTRRYHRVLSFLLLDHIGGINTILSALSSGNTLVIPDSRKPMDICQCIEDNRVDSLITSPTFLNLLLISNAHEQYDLSSLKQINFGSEPMPSILLSRLRSIFNVARFTQSYGLSETGVIRTKSSESNPLHMEIQDSDIQTRICNGMLEIKSCVSMIGYLNYPNPLTSDGWFKTGDLVVVDERGMQIFGRQSEIINIGGEKVYPAEIENILMSLDHVLDATVAGQSNPILGNIVHATIQLDGKIQKKNFLINMRENLSRKLPKYKIPQKVSFVDNINYGRRFKKMRQSLSPTGDKSHVE